MVKNKWSCLALLGALTLGGLTAEVSHAAAEPTRGISAGRITQQRAGALDRREPVRSAEVKKLDRNDNRSRVEVQRMQQTQQRAGRADKRR
jgi:hypothetical protein